ncbi:hypothetical protein D9756_000182 [Leucocoprinus leucothites]|uniref:Velvet domain-containing protein n=1 Tax=Leucocoprinus leucothites TaxID=201217 RepID=A0A8H5GG15_9AGAR|nr:hypothetical protein D9756_000182 [Leucoagaricus leucothites]
MIQQTDRRARRAEPSPPHDTDTDTPASDGPEIWGNWADHRHYSLEVVQHPLRARMCGFGDKDRRPLAPAAVAKMVVRNQDKSIVDVDDIDWSFFLVLVDLWSADGKQEMNLVLHPSSADRYMPIPASKNRRRGASIVQTPVSHSGQQTPIQPSPAPTYRPPEPTPQTPLPTYTAHHQGYFSASAAAPDTYGPPHSHPPPQDHNSQASGWGYAPTGVDRSTTYPPPILPSIHTFAAASTTTSSGPQHPHSATAWGDATTAATAQSTDAYHQHHHQHHYSVDPNHPSSSSIAKPPHDNTHAHGGPVYASQPYGHTHQSIQLTPTHPPPPPSYVGGTPNANYAPNNTMGPPVNNNSSNEKSSSTLNTPTTPATSSAPMTTSYPPMQSPRLAYTRTLVGPLSANATRLQDEHRKPGIFFLFQDLSVRTEGTFRLRMRLMNVGAPPAPEYGATKVHTGSTPVLAQTFTEPFTVFSAKRFPGVPVYHFVRTVIKSVKLRRSVLVHLDRTER